MINIAIMNKKTNKIEQYNKFIIDNYLKRQS